MAWRDKVRYWGRQGFTLGSAVLLLLGAAGVIYAAPAHAAAAVIGILAGALLSYWLAIRTKTSVRLALLWAAIAVTADAAYAKLNDQVPVTLANCLGKVIDACLKLAEPLFRALSLTADPRSKVGAVSTELTWGLILTLVVLLATGFPWWARGRK
jgi:hypothetical protein